MEALSPISKMVALNLIHKIEPLVQILALHRKNGKPLSELRVDSFADTYMWHLALDALTHWGRDKMAAIFQTTYWNAFSWMKKFESRLTFHWSLFLRVQLTIIHPMMVSSLMHICVIWPQWVKNSNKNPVVRLPIGVQGIAIS